MADSLNNLVLGGMWSVIHNAAYQGTKEGIVGFDVEGDRVEIPVTSPRCPLGLGSGNSWVKPGVIGALCYELDGVRFRPYCDQSLRRAPELDQPRGRYVVGWRCDSQPDGFQAPLGVTPGANGEFVRSITTPVTIEVPEELDQLAQEYGLTVENLIRGFIADVCGLESSENLPRADGYVTHGSDERMLARAWLDRAYGMQRIQDFGSVLRQQQELEDAKDDLSGALEEFVEAGGSPEELLKAVGAIVAAKRSGQ